MQAIERTEGFQAHIFKRCLAIERGIVDQTEQTVGLDQRVGFDAVDEGVNLCVNRQVALHDGAPNLPVSLRSIVDELLGCIN